MGMTVLTIRKHSRFAVRQSVTLQGEDGRSHKGLLVELSQGGCRLGMPGNRNFTHNQPVTARIPGYGTLRATVSWTKDEFVGLHFVFALHHHELVQLIQMCRPVAAGPEAAQRQRAFGT
jgi:hypothetical protein